MLLNMKASYQKSVKFFYQNGDNPKKPDCHRVQWFLQWRGANTMFDAWREQFDDQRTDSFLQEEAKFRMLKKQNAAV